MAKIKICGMRRVEDVDFVNELKPDYVGFILSDGFKRSVDMSTALMLKSKLSPDIKAVGVFVDDSREYIDECIKKGIVDIVQLHGNEMPEYCNDIAVPTIKALKPQQFDLLNEYEKCVDYFLFDSGTGSGKTFDWSTIPQTLLPFFLAGGLDSTNLSDALKNVCPYAVDMSSSVETNGIKDFDKIKEVIDIVRSEK